MSQKKPISRKRAVIKLAALGYCPKLDWSGGINISGGYVFCEGHLRSRRRPTHAYLVLPQLAEAVRQCRGLASALGVPCIAHGAKSPMAVTAYPDGRILRR